MGVNYSKINNVCLTDSGAVGVHEWCEIRLILALGRLVCARNQVGFGIRGGLFGYFLPKQKVIKDSYYCFNQDLF
jgi:hypothetical protein